MTQRDRCVGYSVSPGWGTDTGADQGDAVGDDPDDPDQPADKAEETDRTGVVDGQRAQHGRAELECGGKQTDPTVPAADQAGASAVDGQAVV
jgi:hypothetical protein